MEYNKQMDIHVTLGNQNGLQDLTDVNVNFTSNANLVRLLIMFIGTKIYWGI